ncbi:MAG: hypothetical protein AAGI23_21040 [Bacteroidota bacterium]
MYSTFLKYSFGLIVPLFLLSACAEEIVTDFPSAEFSQEDGFVFSDTTLCVGQEFTVRVRMSAGSSNLVQFAIYENDTLLSPNEFTIEGSSSFNGENPITLTNEEQQFINFLIKINPDFPGVRNRSYFFRVVDELNQPVVASTNLFIGRPRITFLDVPNVISSDSVIFIGEDLKLRMQVEDCWNGLQTLEVFEDGNPLPSSQFEIKLAADSSSLSATNPFNIQSPSGEIYDIKITPSPPLADSTSRRYFFRIRNSRDQIGTNGVTIRTIEPTPLQLSSPLAGVLLINQAAGEGNGGLDLDTGESVDAEDEDAEIQDEGIITTDNPERNWRRQISVVDPETTEMRKAQPDVQLSDFIFQEQLVVAYNRGRELEGSDNNTDNSGNPASSDLEQGEEVSTPLSIGDVFIVRREGMYYAIACVDIINEIADDQDRYIFDILY